LNYFTSDWHLGHETILKGIRSKKFANIEEHNETIIDNIFETLKPGDNLYNLGDMFWKWDSKQVEELLTKFKRHKINLFVILGNHDKQSWVKHSCVKWWGQIKDITIEKQPITLCHYPMRTWSRSHYNAWQLYGHIHFRDNTDLRMDYDLLGKQLNMNVEFWNYKPVEFEIIKATMDTKKDNWDLIKK